MPGKRAPNKVAVVAYVDAALKAEVIAKATLEGRTLTEVLEQQLQSYAAAAPALAEVPNEAEGKS